MKITVLAAAIAATTVVSALPAAPVMAKSQHCFNTTQQVCRPTHHGTNVCETITKRHCVNSQNHMRKRQTLKERFVRNSRKRGRRN